LLKTHADRFESALLALDVVLAAWVFLAVFQLSGTRLTGGDAATLVVLAVAAVLTFPIAMSQVGLYASQRRSPLLRVLMQLAVTGAFTTALLVGLVLLLGRPEWAWWTGRCAFLQFAVFSVERACIISGLRMLRLLGRNVRKVVFVGTGPRAVRLVEEIDGHPEWGLQIAAFVDDGETASDPRLGREVVHKLSDFPKLMRRLV
jgi:FlaA1/EpsC-like NDP-sugar epimerase